MTRGRLRTIWVTAWYVKHLNKGGPGGEGKVKHLPRNFRAIRRIVARRMRYLVRVMKPEGLGYMLQSENAWGEVTICGGWYRNYSVLTLYVGVGGFLVLAHRCGKSTKPWLFVITTCTLTPVYCTPSHFRRSFPFYFTTPVVLRLGIKCILIYSFPFFHK
jgi:hypothetical protein